MASAIRLCSTLLTRKSLAAWLEEQQHAALAVRLRVNLAGKWVERVDTAALNGPRERKACDK